MTPASAAVLSSESGVASSSRSLQTYHKWVSSAVLYSTDQIATWRDPALSQVRNLRWLGTGWDGPESLPISESAIETAICLVRGLAEAFPNLIEPTVVPTPYFGVYVEWNSETCAVAFTINEDSTVELEYEYPEIGLEWDGLLEETPFTDLYEVLSVYNNRVLRA